MNRSGQGQELADQLPSPRHCPTHLEHRRAASSMFVSPSTNAATASFIALTAGSSLVQSAAFGKCLRPVPVDYRKALCGGCHVPGKRYHDENIDIFGLLDVLV